jgi:hypothetical protein
MEQKFNIGGFFKTTQGIITGVVSIISGGIFIWGMIAKHDAKIIQKFNEKNKQASQEIRIDTWIKYDSLEHLDSRHFRDTILFSLTGIKDSVRATNKGLRKSSNVLFNLKKYMEDKVATKDGLKEVQGIFDVEKKNNDYWIQ